MEFKQFICVPISPVRMKASATYFEFKDGERTRYFVTDLPLWVRWGDAPYGFNTIEDWAVEIPAIMGEAVFSDRFHTEFSEMALKREAKNNPRPVQTIMDWAKEQGLTVG